MHETAWDQSLSVMLQKRLDAMRQTRWTADQATKHDFENHYLDTHTECSVDS